MCQCNRTLLRGRDREQPVMCHQAILLYNISFLLLGLLLWAIVAFPYNRDAHAALARQQLIRIIRIIVYVRRKRHARIFSTAS